MPYKQANVSKREENKEWEELNDSKAAICSTYKILCFISLNEEMAAMNLCSIRGS